jgi:hypothetical protein
LSNRLQGIKLADLSFTQIKEKLIDKLKLLFASDKWQLVSFALGLTNFSIC